MAEASVDLRRLGTTGTSNHDDQQLPTLNKVLEPDARNDNSESQAPNTEFSLPPVDTGKQAWLFLAACWGVEAVTFGKYYFLH